MYKLLLIEDDQRLASLIREYLTTYEFDVVIVDRGDLALEAFKTIKPDIIILDLMLPGLDGVVVCRQISDISNVPILILTAREDEFDEVSCLEHGADDYVNKPVQPRILLARLRALLRRSQTKSIVETHHPTENIHFGELVILEKTHQVLWRQESIELGNAEYKLLLTLAKSAGEVLSRDELLKKIRGIEFDGLDRSVDNNISRLRRRFDDEQAEKIKTIWGEGYLFNPLAWE